MMSIDMSRIANSTRLSILRLSVTVGDTPSGAGLCANRPPVALAEHDRLAIDLYRLHVRAADARALALLVRALLEGVGRLALAQLDPAEAEIQSELVGCERVE